MKNRLLIIDDEPDFCTMLERHLGEEYEVAAFDNPDEAVRYLGNSQVDAVLTDLRMQEVTGMDVLEAVKSRSPETDVVIMTAYATVETAVEAMRKGAYDYILKPFTLDELSLRLKKLFEKRELIEKNKNLREFIGGRYGLENVIGKSEAMVNARRFIERVSNMDSPVLITGENGAGKHLIARSIHFEGRRKEGRFITVHCGAVPPGLFERVLFGYEAGISDPGPLEYGKGLYEEANGGTLVLVEIGEMDISLQTRFLAVLEKNTMKRVGGSEEIPLDVMIIATSNINLNELQEKGIFRKDLFYRLSAFNLQITPLRERKQDIPLLAEHFLSYYSREFERPDIRLAPETMEALQNYNWPGNVRELKNLIMNICLLEDSTVIMPMHIFKRLALPQDGHIPQQTTISSMESLFEIEKKLIHDALKKTMGNMTTAARLLNISYETLRYRMKKFGFDQSSYKAH